MLPTDATERKETPVFSGFMCYFPDAIVAVAQHSFVSNEQHNPGQPLHWNRSKSSDELDAGARHLLEQAWPITEDERILAATGAAWRAMANLQKLVEKRNQNSDSQKSADGPQFADGEDFVGYEDRVRGMARFAGEDIITYMERTSAAERGELTPGYDGTSLKGRDQ